MNEEIKKTYKVGDVKLTTRGADVIPSENPVEGATPLKNLKIDGKDWGVEGSGGATEEQIAQIDKNKADIADLQINKQKTLKQGVGIRLDADGTISAPGGGSGGGGVSQEYVDQQIDKTTEQINNVSSIISKGLAPIKRLGYGFLNTNGTIGDSTSWYVYGLPVETWQRIDIKTIFAWIATNNLPKSAYAFINTEVDKYNYKTITTANVIEVSDQIIKSDHTILEYSTSVPEGAKMLIITAGRDLEELLVPEVHVGSNKLIYAEQQVSQDSLQVIYNQLNDVDTTYRNLGTGFIKADGTIGESASWQIWLANLDLLKHDTLYEIKTPISLIAPSLTPKSAYVFLNKSVSVSNYKQITPEDVIYVSPVETDTYSFERKYLTTIPKEAKSLLICAGLDNNFWHKPTVKVKSNFYDINKDGEITLNSLDKFAKEQKTEDGSFIFHNDAKKYNFAISTQKNNTKNENIMFELISKYEGQEQPHLHFESGNSGFHWGSISYSIGRKGEYTIQKWRVPAENDDYISIIFSVPANSKLYIKEFNEIHSNEKRTKTEGIMLNAHLGFYSYAPENTMAAYELAEKYGYPVVIANMKLTKDGKLVCCHDDKINKYASNLDGSPIASDVYISQTNYEDLLQYSFGYKKNPRYKDAKIPLLYDFFKFCAKTGVQPMVSTHPNLSEDTWRTIKKMLNKLGILNTFNIKNFDLNNLALSKEVFGDNIASYTYDIMASTDQDVQKAIDELKRAGFDKCKTKVVIEIPIVKTTKNKVDLITQNGFLCYVWDVYNTTSARYNECIDWGVSGFTDDANCCFGLNW